ncbi:exodeoxyribonuclease VII large subunit [Candidatus Uhrbacteria bacterium]|nr:exodeoxyribonuclease VII large subunit [Candidatus Uhrbacteria bacterium]
MAFGSVLSTTIFYRSNLIFTKNPKPRTQNLKARTQNPKPIRTISVSEFIQLINETLRLIPSQEFVVEGEISDFRIAQDKWISFDLKDEKEESVLKCFMTTWQLRVQIEDGMRVQVRGVPKVYERYGQFKMNVQEVVPVGEGALKRAYELLKKKLEAEGLFNVSRKRSLPRFPKRIGLITSRDAAAYGDFLKILNNRWGGIQVFHANIHVQGREAVSDILGAFAYFNELSDDECPDVLVLTRGGGGLEDLHAFNDESVARAVFGSKIPVVCGVGHERDESLCDFVADVRASTPSNAAERIVPNREEVHYEIEMMLNHAEDKLKEVLTRRSFLIERAVNAFGRVWIPLLRERIENFEKILRQLDPKRVLARGYGIITSNGQVLKDVSSIEIGAIVGVQLAKGSFESYVTKKENN